MNEKYNSKDTNVKIALTIPTGRSKVKHVVNSFIENAELHGYDPKQFSIYLSIDTKYMNTRISNYKLKSSLEEKVRKVEYISPARRKEIGSNLILEGFDHDIVSDLFIGRGYSKQRNSALISALKDKNDIAICIDDDEVPYIPIDCNDGKIRWENLDFFSPHIEALKVSDITRGPYMGYLSPIPSDLEEEISPLVRKRLGEALELGNEIVTIDSFFNLMDNIIYLSESEITNSHRPYEVKNSRYGKTILSGNMGINLDSVKAGRIPIFYTPPEARGEDTFFGLQLKDNSVREVPGYIFHDPFYLYPNLFKGIFPNKLKKIPVNKRSIERFANAVLGWLRYAPLFIHMSSKDSEEKNKRISQMIDKIDRPTRELAKLLNYEKLNSCREVLEFYNENVQSHYDNLINAQKFWRNQLIPKLEILSI